MDKKEYFMGFDIGTGSVGWAVTDTEYNLVKINRKLAWGSVLFETSEGAESRRLYRCARRRNERAKERLALLRELFEEEIYKVDAGFFHRLQESRFVPEDKQDMEGLKPELPYALFVDENYTDIDYHSEFPTIYHLRKALMQEEREFDVRLVYLAVAHILKNRGHFLANMGSDEININFIEVFDDLINAWNVLKSDETQECISLTQEQKKEIEQILKNIKLTKTGKKQEIISILNNPGKEEKELVSLLCGGKVTLAKLFDNLEYDSLEETKVCFDDASYKEKEEYLANNLEDDFDIIAKSKLVYDAIVLASILKGDDSGYLSVAKVKDYEKHKHDLKVLKRSILEEGTGTEVEKKKLFKRVFGLPQKGDNNYTTYVGSVSLNGKKRVVEEKKCIKSDFYKFLNKHVLPFLQDGESKKYIEEQILLESFMPKARVKENSVIPYQMHARELKRILENAQRYLPFLQEVDDSGKTVRDKILMLLTFRIPYYVGPLNNSHSNAWIVKNESGKITPWNFEQKVNVEESAKAFIERMTSKCTYLRKENVLPKSSLLYEKYMVLNEINHLTIKSEPISVELKQRIYSNLFERKVKVTVHELIKYLKREEGMLGLTKEDIGGIDIEIKSSLKSYHAFKREFTGTNLAEQEKEDIIKDMTLFGAEPQMLKRRLFKKYPKYEKQITALIKSLKCKEWGRLSYKLLNGIALEESGQGKIGTIMYYLWTTNLDLMKLVALKDSQFTKLIEDENKEEAKKGIQYQMIEALYVSPSVKRQIWKATQVLEEIMKAMGSAPKRVFVEMAREHAESKRSVTRKDKLLDLYKSIKDEKELFEQLKAEQNDKLKSDKLFLYYTQLGRCAYTGKYIKIEELFNDNLYDIDHIYPQSKTADDSIDNRVLVCKEENLNKLDTYPINSNIQEKMRMLWSFWKQKGLITERKFQRLVRTTELTTEELTGFINRQLVETRQSTKEFINVLKQLLPKDTEIVYSKAKNVARFRQHYNILKVREINDLHHAKDAYLNIVVGNVYHLKFTKDVRKYLNKNGTYRTYNLNKMFNYNVEYLGEIAWKVSSKKEGLATICTVKRTIESDKVLVTKQVFERKGQLFDVQPLKKGKGQVSLKSGKGNERLSDIEKYGGYNGATITYFSLIEGKDKKCKSVRFITPVPLYLSAQFEKDINQTLKYFEEEYKITEIKILIKKIPIQSLMVSEGFKMRLATKMDSRIVYDNANQLSLSKVYSKVVKEISKFNAERLEKKDVLMNEKNGISDELLMQLYDEFIDKLENTVYKEMLGSFSEVLKKGREKYAALTKEEKALQAYRILKLFQCTPEMPDLSQIGGSKNPGRIRMSMNVTNRKSLALIHQSVTGLYEKIERINP